MSPDLPPQYCTYPQAMKSQENDYVSGQQSEYIRCYTPFALLYVTTADSMQKQDFFYFFHCFSAVRQVDKYLLLVTARY